MGGENPQMESVSLGEPSSNINNTNNIPPPPPYVNEPSSAPSSEPEAAPVVDSTARLQQRLTGAFAFICGACILLWFLIGAGFPWFMYVIFAASFIECLIYAGRTKNSYFANWSIYINVNIILFLTYLATGGGYPWFIFPLCSMAILPLAQMIGRKVEDRKLRWFYIHLLAYTLINVMLFFTWMINSLDNPYPWFIYSWCGWGILVLIQYNYAVMHNKKKLLFYIVADICVMVAIAVRFAIGVAFIIFISLGALAVIVFLVARKKGYTIQFLKNAVPVLPIFQSTPQPPPQNGEPVVMTSPTSGRVHIPVGPDGTILPIPSENGVSYPLPPQYQYGGYQNMPPPPPVYNNAPVYYHPYYPQGNMYPSLATLQNGVPPQGMPIPQSSSSPQPPRSTSPSFNNNNNDAVLADKKEEEEKDEEGRLLRGSPKSYSSNQN